MDSNKSKQSNNLKSQTKFERYIISCMLNDSNVIDDVLAKLTIRDFFDQKLRCVYQAISDIHHQSKPVNNDTVIEYLSKNQELSSMIDDINSYVCELSYAYTTSINLSSYIDLVKEFSIKSQLNDFAGWLINEPADFTRFKDQSFEWLTKFSAIVNSKKVDNVEPISDIINDYKISLTNMINSDHTKLTGISSGFKNIDRITDGFQKGDLIILAARPGTGKTALALNFVLNAAKDIKSQKQDVNKKPGAVVLFSIEMSKKQVIERMLACESKVNITKIKRGDLVGPALLSIENYISEIHNLPIFIDDTSNLSILDIQAKLRQIKANYDIKLVVVDYLQLLKGISERANVNNRQQEVANISRMLKITAREIETPIMALAQLSRKIEDRGKTADGANPRPLLSDLRESGAIEQDADIVSFLYYKKNQVEESNDNDETENKKIQQNPLGSQDIEYIIEKHRNGATGSVTLGFTKAYGYFSEVENSFGGKYE